MKHAALGVDYGGLIPLGHDPIPEIGKLYFRFGTLKEAETVFQYQLYTWGVPEK